MKVNIRQDLCSFKNMYIKLVPTAVCHKYIVNIRTNYKVTSNKRIRNNSVNTFNDFCIDKYLLSTYVVYITISPTILSPFYFTNPYLASPHTRNWNPTRSILLLINKWNSTLLIINETLRSRPRTFATSATMHRR